MDSDSDYLTDDVEKDEEPKEVSPRSTQGFGERHLLELKETLGLDSFAAKKAAKSAKRKRQKERKKVAKQAAAASGSDIIQTVATQRNESLQNQQPEVVEYCDPRKAKKKAAAVATESNSQESGLAAAGGSLDQVSMKEARFDVFKFGVKGFDKEGQMSAREALAVRLGAKPAKNKALPYKEYKAKMREERAKEAEAKQERKHQLLTSARSTISINPKKKGLKATPKDNKNNKNNKKRKGGGAGINGLQPQIGRFDGGMLKLSAKEIAAMKSKKW